MRRLSTRLIEINAELRNQQLPADRRQLLLEEVGRIGAQIRAHQLSLGVMAQAVDPEQFNLQLELLLRGGHLTPEQAARLREIRELAASRPVEGESAEAATARAAAQREMRAVLGEANLRMHLQEGNLTDAQANQVREWRARLATLQPGSAEHTQLEGQIRGVMQPAWQAWSAREQERERVLIEDAKKDAPPGSEDARLAESARNVLAARARRLMELGQRMAQYDGNPELMAAHINSGLLDARDIAEYRLYQQDRTAYERRLQGITEALDRLGVDYRPVPSTTMPFTGARLPQSRPNAMSRSERPSREEPPPYTPIPPGALSAPPGSSPLAVPPQSVVPPGSQSPGTPVAVPVVAPEAAPKQEEQPQGQAAVTPTRPATQAAATPSETDPQAGPG
jgi:hypothetical protein